MSKHDGREVERVGAAVTLTRESALALIRMLASYGDEDRVMTVRVMNDDTGLAVVDIAVGGGMGCVLPVTDVAVVLRDGDVPG